MAIEFPPGCRNAVCFSFDFDGLSLWFGTFKDFSSHAIGRGEYSGRVAAERVLEFLERREMRCTWFVPGHTAGTWPTLTHEIAHRGHEIAHHGYCHEDPTGLSKAEERSLLVRGIEALTTVTGQKPLGYRSPAWNTSDHTVELLVEHGFAYAGNGMADDYRPYRARVGDLASTTQPFAYGSEVDLLEIPSAWFLSDLVLLEPVYQYPNRVSPSPSEVERIWIDEFDYMCDHAPGGVLTFALHPEGIARGHRLKMLERVVDHMGQRGDVWFCTMLEIARAWSPDPPGLWADGATAASSGE
jgi:peptidoglycan/xylan/chitin deacetylase (PgdA/CDA1 family)